MMRKNNWKKRVVAGWMAGVFSLGVGGAFATSAEAATSAEPPLTEMATLLGHGPSPSHDKVSSDKERKELEKRRKEDEQRQKKEMEKRRKEDEQRRKKEMEKRRKEDEQRRKEEVEKRRKEDEQRQRQGERRDDRVQDQGNDRPAPLPRFR